MSLQNKGLDYFSLNVDFFDNDKIALIEAEHGWKGSLITLKLLCRIYKEGFYCRWDKDICLLFCRKAGIEVDIQFMDALLQSLLERHFFDTNLFHKFGILTSRSIQIRFFEATVRRRKIEVTNADFLLINASDYKNVYILPRNVDMDTVSTPKNVDIPKQSKVKESIVEKSRVNLQQQQQQRASEEPEKEPQNLDEEREQWKDALLADEDWRATIVRYAGKGIAVLQYTREAMAVFDDFLRLKFSLDTIRTKKDYSQSFIGWWRYHNFNLKPEELSGGVPLEHTNPPVIYSSGKSGRPSRIQELIETGQRATEIAMKICNSQAV